MAGTITQKMVGVNDRLRLVIFTCTGDGSDGSFPATDIAGITVERFDDLARGDGGLPPTDGLRYSLVDRSRVIVRPSGTEPKVKIYCEVIEPVVGTLESARARARARMSVIRERMESLTTIDTEGDDES